jgi:hypothetical protein
MNSDIPLPTGNVVTLPIKELTPKEQLKADMLHLKGWPAPNLIFRANGSVIAPPFRFSSKKERSRAKRLVKKAQRA